VFVPPGPAARTIDPSPAEPLTPAGETTSGAVPDPARDEILFELLRELRRTIARERGIPPYLVFNDRTLALLSLHKPVTREGFRAIKGIGDKKADDLGPQFLEAIAAHIRSGPGRDPP
jgi:ATP-dependent DNA helicase RecQ